MSRLKQSWLIFFTCLKILYDNKRLLIFSGCSIILEIVLFVLIFGVMIFVYLNGQFSQLWTLERHPPLHWFYFFYLIFYYFLFHFLSHILQGGLLIYLWHKLQNRSVSMIRGVSLAAQRCIFIIQWIFLFTLMNLFVRTFERPNNWFGRMSRKHFGSTWRLSSTFVFPILMLQEKSPWQSLKVSGGLIQSFWGDRVSGRLGFNWIYFISLLPMIPFLFYGFFYTSSHKIQLLIASISAIYIVILTVIHSIAYIIFQLSLYGYITHQLLPKCFKTDWLDNAFW